MSLRNLSLLLCLMAWSGPVFAFDDFLDAWRAYYPDSNSDDIGGDVDGGCQLCHANPGGMEPWNEYGWVVRQAYIESGSIDITIGFEEAEDDTFGDPTGATVLNQINNHYQPGWMEGAVNTLYEVGNQIPNQSPPDTLASTTALDFPDPNEITDPIPGGIPTGAVNIQLATIAGDFNAPVSAVRAPGINGSLFVVEQTGRIFRVDLDTGAKTLFHDVSGSLVNINPNYDERGLLGLAFHPDYANNGLFYTYQSEPRRAFEDGEVDFSTTSSPNHRSMIVEYKASDPSCNSFIREQKNLMIIDQPQSNHNGGDLAFGPDGYLYIALGDGGGADDRGQGHGPNGTGRDNTNPLGAILRIDPDGDNSANGKYGIPGNNPFVGGGDPGVDEIFAYGFRNPYRMSFDVQDGDLYTGDVGQAEIEEVDIVTLGGNYGWNWKEGSFFFYSNAELGRFISETPPPGVPNDLVDPVAEYDHDEGVSVISGYVYRGARIPSLQGRFVFGEYLSRLFYLDSSDDIQEFFLNGALQNRVYGFGQDADNELYVVTNNTGNPAGTEGTLEKIIPAGGNSPPPDNTGESAQCPPSDDLCIPIVTANGNVAFVCL